MIVLKIITKYLPLATVAIMMAACASEDFVGNQELKQENENGKAISFSLTAAPQTRAPQTGDEAAVSLNNNFVIWGEKTMSDASHQPVFKNYQVNYVTNSANTTTSNSAGWEYVGYKNLPNGTATAEGESLNTNGVAANANGVDQSIKYWDYSATKYDFFAYSLGLGHTTTGESPTTTYAMSSPMSSYTYRLSGTKDQLAACYISDLYTKTDMSATNAQVLLNFRKLESQVRIALYETIPGYSVKDVKFYQSASAASSGTEAYIYTPEGSIPQNGTYRIDYTAPETPATGHTVPTVTWVTDDEDPPVTVTYDSYVDFGNAVTTTGTTWTDWADHDYQETTGEIYIGRTSNEATKSPYVSVLPNPGNTANLHLKVDFTLVSRDGYGETIKVTGATAVVPAAYAKWQPNYNYTYIFKISDETNATIGSITGLYPITLNAQVITDPVGNQETVTTVSDPSITTYQKGSDYATTNEYKAGTIYVVVDDGTTLTIGTNANLYTATVTLADPDNDVANITETSVANAIASPTGAKDANGNDLTVTLIDPENTPEPTDKLTAITAIPAADAPHGVALTINGAKFTATAGTTYVFEYINGTDKYYKVIKVAAGS